MLLIVGDCIRVSSSYAGNFCVSRLAVVRRLVMFAAGTGFTPTASLIADRYAEDDSLARSVLIYLLRFGVDCG